MNETATLDGARAAAPTTRAEWFGEQAHAAWQEGQAALLEGRLAEARRWFERAYRLAPGDATARLALAVVLLRQGDAACADHFAAVASDYDVREAWLGLAAARAAAKAWGAAAAALSSALSRHATPLTGDIDDLATRVAAGVGAPGWCCVRADLQIGVVCAPFGRTGVATVLDGRRLQASPARVPRRGNYLDFSRGGAALLGSPLDLARFRRVEGFVENDHGGLTGWAWQPGNPDVDPVLLVGLSGAGRPVRVVATDTDMNAGSPMARPRRFRLAAADLPPLPGLLHVTGADGRDLTGSPLDPRAESRAAAAVARAVGLALPVPRRRAGRSAPPDPLTLAVRADLAGPPACAAAAQERPVAVIVPVYRDHDLTLACLESVRATMPADTRLIVVDDATPEPALAEALDAMAGRGEIQLLRHAINRGFPAAVNAGLRAACSPAGRRDVLLLNSDALLSEGAIAGLRAVVHGAADIGTATALSNDAAILSYPDASGGNPAPQGRALARLARLVARANGGGSIDIPTAVGFCMYIRRECLDTVGLLREDVFAQGYGEENDFCVRARHLGWRHVAASGVFVAHVGGRSFRSQSGGASAGFGAARDALRARNLAVLERLHPGYHAMIAAYQAADPLAPARRRIDLARWTAQRRRGGVPSVILVTHDSGGGVERAVRARCDALRRDGVRPILLRPVLDPAARSDSERAFLPGLCEVGDGESGGFPNLRFSLPAELPALARMLRAERPAGVEIHHLLGHDHAVTRLAEMLAVPCDVHVHDYACFCPRITLLGPERRYCGEPTDPALCEACIADAGRKDEQRIGVAALRERSARDFAGARRVVVPAADVASRLRRHFPDVQAEVRHLEDDDTIVANAIGTRPKTAMERAAGSRRRVCVLGGIGVDKGYDVLLACARDAAARALALEFVVVGHTTDDARLFATRRAFVTGPYREADVVAEIHAQRPDVAFLPSIWPETWSYTLGHAWRAGLYVAAFDIGAPAERIRRSGRGFLLPLGLPPTAINNVLLTFHVPNEKPPLAAPRLAGDECVRAARV